MINTNHETFQVIQKAFVYFTLFYDHPNKLNMKESFEYDFF